MNLTWKGASRMSLARQSLRVARLPAEEGARDVVWQNVAGVHYLAEGRSRWLVVTYRNGATVKLQPHQARELWHEVETHKGCDAPCFYRGECDTAPTECACCQLAENLEGLDIKVLPDPVPMRVGRQPDLRNCAIAALLLFIIVLIGVKGSTPLPSPTTTHAQEGSAFRGKPIGRVGEAKR